MNSDFSKHLDSLTGIIVHYLLPQPAVLPPRLILKQLVVHNCNNQEKVTFLCHSQQACEVIFLPPLSLAGPSILLNDRLLVQWNSAIALQLAIWLVKWWRWEYQRVTCAWHDLLWDIVSVMNVTDLAKFGLTAILCRPLLIDGVGSWRSEGLFRDILNI